MYPVIRTIVILLSLLIIGGCSSIRIQLPQYEYVLSEEFEDKELYLQKYAPVLYFHEKEKYYPISVESFLENAVLVKRRILIPFDKTKHRRMITGDLLQKYNSTDYYLKINRGIFGNIRNKYMKAKDAYPVTVYANGLKITNGDTTQYVLQYWFFYWASEAGKTGIVWHECDWELVMILLDEEMNPLKAGYSQHYYGKTIDWEEVSKVNGHPAVFVGRGTHASNFAAGKVHSYFKGNRKIKLGGDVYGDDIRITPGEYSLILIDGTTDWVAFKGYWGLPLTTKLAGPKYRNPGNADLCMWKNPLGWFEKYR